jgi:hypothetical protein
MRQLALLILFLATLVLAPRPCEAAPSASKSTLMHIAYPGWNGRGPWLMQVPSDNEKPAPTWIAATPARIVRLDPSHLVLLVTGSPTDEARHDIAAHVSEGHLGAVWFVRERGGWVVSHRRDDLLWAGSFGDLGTVAAFDLGRGHRAVSVRSGNCWMGGCMSMLDIVELDADHAARPFPSTRVASDSLELNDACGPVLHPPRGARRAIPEDLDESNCFEIAATWRLDARAGAQRPDIVLRFRGHELTLDAATKSLSVKAVDETQVFRYQDGRYSATIGRNPTRDP